MARDIKLEVHEIISKILEENKENIDQKDFLFDYEKWDSLNHAQIIVSIEEKFSIEIPKDLKFSLISVSDIVSLVEKTLA